MTVVRAIATANARLSNVIDRALPRRLRQDGNRTFREEYIPRALVADGVIYDIGGGARPFVTLDQKQRFGLTVIGLDISPEELSAAPEGVYDRTIVADLCQYSGIGDADAVVCQATLEHVPDTAGAMRAIASVLKPGGRAYIFAPCRNAVFARLNLMLPEELKRKLLWSLLGEKAEGHGFPAYYDRCTPTQIEDLATENGLIVEERRLFWVSSYFRVFTPAFVLWRMFQALAYLALGNDAAETFIYVLQKPDHYDV